MFWKKKGNKAEPPKNVCKSNDDLRICMANVLKREIRHTKSIICGKLYDTEKAEKISVTKDGRLLFVTKKGNYFSCSTENSEYIRPDEKVVYQVYEIIYSDIRPETEQYARENIGMFEPEKYIDLFGEVEEA